MCVTYLLNGTSNWNGKLMNGWKWRRVVAITRFVDLMVLRRKMRLMDGFFYFTLIWFFFSFWSVIVFLLFLLFSFSFPTPPATYFLRFPSFQVSIAPIIRQIFFFFRSLIGELEALGFIFIWGNEWYWWLTFTVECTMKRHSRVMYLRNCANTYRRSIHGILFKHFLAILFS